MLKNNKLITSIISASCLLMSVTAVARSAPPTKEDSEPTRCHYYHSDLETSETERYAIRILTEAACPAVPEPSQESLSVQHLKTVIIDGKPTVIENPDACVFFLQLVPEH